MAHPQRLELQKVQSETVDLSELCPKACYQVVEPLRELEAEWPVTCQRIATHIGVKHATVTTWLRSGREEGIVERVGVSGINCGWKLVE